MTEEIPERETKRQYRVLQQTLSAHSFLRDDYTRNAKWAKIVLTASSILFCTTTFAGNSFYTTLGVGPEIGRLVVGVAAIVAVIASVTLLIIDWEGKAAHHEEDAKTWSRALEEFRRHRGDNGSWCLDKRVHLDSVYWEADHNSSNIPAQRFNALKSRHLRKVTISQLKSDYPGCPRILLAIFLRARDITKAFRSVHQTREKDHVEP